MQVKLTRADRDGDVTSRARLPRREGRASAHTSKTLYLTGIYETEWQFLRSPDAANGRSGEKDAQKGLPRVTASTNK